MQSWLRFRDWLAEDFLGGPRLVKMSWVINAQKGSTALFVLLLIFGFGADRPVMWVYFALHGSYGLIWLLKDAVLPDPNWEKRITLGGAFNMWLLVLGPYWLAPALLAWSGKDAPGWLLGMAGMIYALGVVLMIGSDAQKYFVLRARRGLITDGFFSRIRHPNYLGEMILYASFAMLAQHWLPWLILAWVWGGVFLPNMLRKEASMARYPEWAAYKARSGMLLPKLMLPTGTAASAPPANP